MDLHQSHWEAIRDGDVTSYEMIFRTFYKPLCSYAYTFLKDPEEAEEVVQTSFIQLWEKREELGLHTSLKSYLYSMVRNGSLNRLKHHKVRDKYEQEKMHVMAASTDDASEMVIAGELEVRISEAIDRLPEQCRLVFKMNRYEDMKYADIARELNISLKTVENHIGKALKLLRAQLSDFLTLLLVFINTLY